MGGAPCSDRRLDRADEEFEAFLLELLSISSDHPRDQDDLRRRPANRDHHVNRTQITTP